jgi:hypothetical protein
MSGLEKELKSIKYENELRKKGWTYLGDTDYKELVLDGFFQIKGQIWCKEGEFALFTIAPETGERAFIKLIERSEAIVSLYEYVQTFVDVFKQQDESMAKERQTTTCSNCGKELKKEQVSLRYIDDIFGVYVFCSLKCQDEYKRSKQ